MEFTKLPACKRYVKENVPEVLYSLALNSTHTENTDENARSFHALMVADRIILRDSPLPRYIPSTTCLDISQKYRCTFVCHLCPYAKNNKNKHEVEESIVLSYALKNYDNFAFIRDSGLTDSHLTSRYLINEEAKDGVLHTITLFYLAYNYMLHKVRPDTDFSTLPRTITNEIALYHQEKLLPANFSTIYAILLRLQKEYPGTSQEKALELSRLLQKKDKIASDIAKPCITGLLSDKPDRLSFNSPSAPAVIQKPAEISDTYLPLVFSTKELEGTAYPLTLISAQNGNYRILESFLQFNPMIGMEIVTDAESKKETVLLCGSDTFLYLDADDEKILEILAKFLKLTRARRQICMEPYRLYHFLSQNHLCYDNVFSLRGAYKQLAEERGNTFKGIFPANLVKELLSKENIHQYTPYVFVMPFYVKMQEVLSGHPALQSKEAKFRLRRQASIDALMGISYEYRLLSGERKKSFTLDERRDPAFTYQNGQKLDGGIFCVTFTFSSEKPLGCLVSNLLYRIASKHLPDSHGYRLLRFSSSSFTVSTPAEEYKYLCDLVANIATYLSEQDNLIPLFIKEDCCK